MKKYIEPVKELDAIDEYDVIIIGGGVAGLVAAIASGRNKVKTLLIERFGYLGGTATASLMININGFRNQVEPDNIQTVKGIAQEIIIELHKIDGLGKSPYPQKEYNIKNGELSYSYCIDPEKFKYITLKMVNESEVDILFHSYFSDVIMESQELKGIIVENKSGRIAFFSKVFIDSTGDGDVAARAGAPFWQAKSEDYALKDTIMYKISGIKNAQFGNCRYGDSSVVWGPTHVWGQNNAWQISQAEIKTRLNIFRHFRRLLKLNPQLRDIGAYVAETPPMIGIRQTRFIEGKYKLTAEDAISGKRFDDVVAISSAPIIHYYGYRRYLEHEGYDIPYRCLTPQKIDNLLIAGRCISSEQEPYESHRSMAPIMAIGQAAGTAAALCAKNSVKPKELNVRLLQRTLISQGQEIRKKLSEI
ncbi:MAG: FAD-dependent oxidoreductase [Promethearchaeota archaeon]|nr:MAG: FAD-dependent oxidoreductase [Candidatus Lokiarchaeota archaeon]